MLRTQPYPVVLIACLPKRNGVVVSPSVSCYSLIKLTHLCPGSVAPLGWVGHTRGRTPLQGTLRRLNFPSVFFLSFCIFFHSLLSCVSVSVSICLPHSTFSPSLSQYSDWSDLPISESCFLIGWLLGSPWDHPRIQRKIHCLT